MEVPLQIAGVLVVPMIIGLVEVAKRSGLDAAWAAPLSIVLGLVASLGFAATHGPVAGDMWYQAALWGVAFGLSASGLYSGAKAVGEALTSPKTEE
jgi:hypothetical protein